MNTLRELIERIIRPALPAVHEKRNRLRALRLKGAA